ncbi:MAG TPA: hypothetical protein VE053_00865 [Allosphingosinicella sp.]|nr:hypothetical protein [Allosphingosinicella sp.]
MNRFPLAFAAPLLMFGCGQDGAADHDAALDRAAGQSNPEAEDILRNAADPGGDAEAQGKGP